VYATARTVVVGESPLRADQRGVLDHWRVANATR
jgi:hypothetical protein